MFDLWPVRSKGVGISPTDWDIILPFGAATGLDEEDMAILAEMCRAYSEELEAGSNPLTIPPTERGQPAPHDE